MELRRRPLRATAGEYAIQTDEDPRDVRYIRVRVAKGPKIIEIDGPWPSNLGQEKHDAMVEKYRTKVKRVTEPQKEARLMCSLPVWQPPPCKGCGACCRGLSVEVTQLEADRIMDRPGASLVEFHDDGWWMRHRKADSSCFALDRKTNTCMIYDQRPSVCRDYRPGPQCEKLIVGHSQKGA